MNELKLETVTLGEDPGFLLQMIRAYAAQETVDPEAARAREVRIRREAEAALRVRLGPLRRPIFMGVLRQARRRVRDRENLRFERTRVFGVVRRIFLALGERLAPDRLATSPSMERPCLWVSTISPKRTEAGAAIGASARVAR